MYILYVYVCIYSCALIVGKLFLCNTEWIYRFRSANSRWMKFFCYKNITV